VGHGRGILFLDEITTAPPAVQAALLRVVLERVVGDVALPEAVSVVAAAILLTLPRVDGTQPSPRQSFCHLDWPVDVERYVAALTDGGRVPRSE